MAQGMREEMRRWIVMTGTAVLTLSYVDRTTVDLIQEALVLHSGESTVAVERRSDGRYVVYARRNPDLVRMAVDTIRFDFACLRPVYIDRPEPPLIYS